MYAWNCNSWYQRLLLATLLWQMGWNRFWLTSAIWKIFTPACTDNTLLSMRLEIILATGVLPLPVLTLDGWITDAKENAAEECLELQHPQLPWLLRNIVASFAAKARRLCTLVMNLSRKNLLFQSNYPVKLWLYLEIFFKYKLYL